jgi:hypothetical protein
MTRTNPRRARLFDLVLIGCVGFVLLTTLAMLFYPGGAQKNPQQLGYSFTLNFFSDLGRTVALNGTANPIAHTLFTLALSFAGLALALFFVTFALFFWTTLPARCFSLLGAGLGIVAGAAFIGVALVTSDRNSPRHIYFVLLAFRCFLGAVLPFALAILTQKSYPRLGAWIFLAFAGFLAAYIALITLGPTPQEPGGLTIQVVGQKLIVYASIVCVGTQSIVARRYLAHLK